MKTVRSLVDNLAMDPEFFIQAMNRAAQECDIMDRVFDAAYRLHCCDEQCQGQALELFKANAADDLRAAFDEAKAINFYPACHKSNTSCRHIQKSHGRDSHGTEAHTTDA
ncbi:MAG: hypothetical protein ABFD92_02120 [Planctomycetaceae bacterium]|nr:hypothetical protein [Planctomycetaceae bacterium]